MTAPPEPRQGDRAILGAIGRGELSHEEGQAIAAVVEQQRRAIETVELAERIEPPMPARRSW